MYAPVRGTERPHQMLVDFVCPSSRRALCNVSSVRRAVRDATFAGRGVLALQPSRRVARTTQRVMGALGPPSTSGRRLRSVPVSPQR